MAQDPVLGLIFHITLSSRCLLNLKLQVLYLLERRRIFLNLFSPIWSLLKAASEEGFYSSSLLLMPSECCKGRGSLLHYPCIYSLVNGSRAFSLLLLLASIMQLREFLTLSFAAFRVLNRNWENWPVWVKLPPLIWKSYEQQQRLRSRQHSIVQIWMVIFTTIRGTILTKPSESLYSPEIDC